MLHSRDVSYVIRVRSIQPEFGIAYLPVKRNFTTVGKPNEIQIPVRLKASQCSKEDGIPHMPTAKVFKIAEGSYSRHMCHFPNTVHQKMNENFLGVFKEKRFHSDLGKFTDIEFREYGSGEFVYVQARLNVRNFEVLSISYIDSPSIGKSMRQTTWNHPEDIDIVLSNMIKRSLSIDYEHQRIKAFTRLGLVPPPEVSSSSIDEFGEHY